MNAEDATPESKKKKPAPIERDWVSKTLAGMLLGLALGMGASGLYSALNPQLALPVRGQIALWLVPPIWLITFGSVYFFQNGRRAWAWLGGANVLVLAAFLMARTAG